MSGFGQILVPIDYSEPSSAALELAAHIARAFKGRLLVLHLLPIEVYAVADYPVVTGDGVRVAEETQRLSQHVRDLLGPEAPAYEVEVTWGSPYLQIVDYAIERRADLIVIGTHGRTGIKHVLLGSVAEKTVRLAPCPVLTVRGPAEPVASGQEGAPVTRQRHIAQPGEVGEMMRRNPLTIGAADTLERARIEMAKAGIRHLPVVAGERLVGMLSDRDLAAHAGHLERTKVDVAMTPEPTTVSSDVTAVAAARLMLERHVRALPVVDGERLVGILSASDILEDYIRAARG
jgi:CBS domain-containing protein/nucleotide-binding universal stress UspA family protein